MRLLLDVAPFCAGIDSRLVGHEGRVNALAVTANGACAVSGGRDGTLRLWDLETGAEITAF